MPLPDPMIFSSASDMATSASSRYPLPLRGGRAISRSNGSGIVMMPRAARAMILVNGSGR